MPFGREQDRHRGFFREVALIRDSFDFLSIIPTGGRDRDSRDDRGGRDRERDRDSYRRDDRGRYHTYAFFPAPALI